MPELKIVQRNFLSQLYFASLGDLADALANAEREVNYARVFASCA